MKRLAIKTLSVALVLVMVAFNFAGCDLVAHGNHIFPEGYTCGWGLEPGAPGEYWWVETYDECIEAIELLKSHGSTFAQDIVLAYDEDLFDVKYCFFIIGDGRHGERIRFGDNPFDRWAYDIKVMTFTFFDDVTIDELVYSYVGRYEAYRIGYGKAFEKTINDNVSKDQLEIGDWEKMYGGKTTSCYRNIYFDDEILIHIQTEFSVPAEGDFTKEFEKMDECIDYIIKSARSIKLNIKE